MKTTYQVQEQHIGPSRQRTSTFRDRIVSRKERNINSGSSNQNSLVRRGFTHQYLATSHMVTTTVKYHSPKSITREKLAMELRVLHPMVPPMTIGR